MAVDDAVEVVLVVLPEVLVVLEVDFEVLLLVEAVLPLELVTVAAALAVT